MAAALRTVAGVAPGLSDSELSDLASQLGRTAEPGPVRVALVAATQEELARLCADGAALLPGLEPGRLAARPGLFAADRAAGRVVLLFPGEAAVTAGGHDSPERVSPSALAQASLAALRWLDALGLRAAAGVGVGVGEITALTWSGSLAQADAATLIAERAAILSAMAGQRTALICVTADEAPCGPCLRGPPGRRRVLRAALPHPGRGPGGGRHPGPAGGPGRDPGPPLDLPYALHSPAMSHAVAPLRAAVARARFTAPARRVISTVTPVNHRRHRPGHAPGPPAHLAGAAGRGAQRGGGRGRSAAGHRAGPGAGHPGGGLLAVPAVSLGTARTAPRRRAPRRRCSRPAPSGPLVPLLSGRPSRPFDIARTPALPDQPMRRGDGRTGPAGHGPAGEAAADAPASRASAAGRPGGLRARPGVPPVAGRVPGAAGLPAGGPPTASGLAATGPYGTPGSGAAAADGAVPGVAPWVRCFAEELRPLPLPAVPG